MCISLSRGQWIFAMILFFLGAYSMAYKTLFVLSLLLLCTEYEIAHEVDHYVVFDDDDDDVKY